MESKIVLFLVEGPSDKIALENIFKKIYATNRNLTFKFLNGDITSDSESTPDNIVSKVESKVDAFIHEYKLQKSDIFSIAQLFDMDGAYIPDENIIEDSDKHYYYSSENIISNDRRTVIERNERKRNNLNTLLDCNTIKDIPFECYFMSCNLDHALYNMQNLDDNQKSSYATEFSKAFSDRETKFPDYIEDIAASGNGASLNTSWRYIKTNLHSLERNTNLNLYFRLHPIL